MPALITALVTVAALTIILASLLVIANRKLYVVEDPRIDAVEDLLPHANCGACGYPGCRPFAEALVAGTAAPGKCTVNSEEGSARIGAYLGVAVGAQQKRVARLACAGGANVARNRARYQGLQSCAGAAQVAGGGKGCFWGCLGLGDCVVACDFDAIFLNPHGLPVVVEDRCTACGDCVTACPKDLLSLHSIDHRLWVACKSQEAGDELLDDCEVACTACGRCAMDAPEVITLRNHLPVIDYTGPHHRSEAIERCPTGAIVWLEANGRVRTGPAAHKVIRQGPRPDAAT